MFCSPLRVLLKIQQFQKEEKVKGRRKMQGPHNLVLPLGVPEPASSHCIFSYHPHSLLIGLHPESLIILESVEWECGLKRVAINSL